MGIETSKVQVERLARELGAEKVHRYRQENNMGKYVGGGTCIAYSAGTYGLTSKIWLRVNYGTYPHNMNFYYWAD